MPISKINEESVVFGLNQGPVLDVRTPEGFTVTIREWDGEDEDNLSKMKDNQDGTATFKFLAGIVKGLNGTPAVLTWQEVAKWKVRTIYYVLFKSRIFTYGSKMVWDHTFKSGEVITQVEDLNRFDWDLSKGSPPKKGEEGYSPDRIKPYESNADLVESTTSTGKRYRWKPRTGEDEIATMDIKIDDLSVNDKLRIRQFQLYTGTQWVEVQRMNVLKAVEANEIRNKIDDLDSEFMLKTVCKRPRGAGEEVSLLEVADFFYPQS